MSGQKTSFTTSFNRTIPFVPGHAEFIRRTSGFPERIDRDCAQASLNNAKDGRLDYKKVGVELKDHRASLSLNGYAARWRRVYQFMELARNTGVQFPFARCLDIGCGNALQPRIMKGLGLIKESVGIDLYDRSSGIDERVLKRQHRQLYRMSIMEPVQQYFANLPSERRVGWRRAVALRLRNPRAAARQYDGWMHDDGFYHQNVRGAFTLDRLIIGSIFDLQERFDLITSFSSLEWFEANTILKKVSDLLEVGGIFYLWVPNWWHAVNTTTLAGHFPYACQRLTKEDFFRYVDEHLAEYAEAMKVMYGYFDPNHPTLSEYIRIGFEHGLVPLAHYSHINPDPFSAKYGIQPLGYLTNDFSGVQSVMEDIHCFRPDVRVEDLLPRTLSFIFRKVDRTNRLDQKVLDNAHRQLWPK